MQLVCTINAEGFVPDISTNKAVWMNSETSSSPLLHNIVTSLVDKLYPDITTGVLHSLVYQSEAMRYMFSLEPLKDFFFYFLFLVSYLPPRAQTPPPPPDDDFMDDDMDSYLIAMDTSIAPGPSATCPPTPPLAVSTCSKQPAAANHRSRLIADEEEEEEDAELADSAGPPNKKVWFSFHMN